MYLRVIAAYANRQSPKYGPAYANRRADDVVDVSVLSQGVPACRDGNDDVSRTYGCAQK